MSAKLTNSTNSTKRPSDPPSHQAMDATRPPEIGFQAALELYQLPLRRQLVAGCDVEQANHRAAGAFLALERSRRSIDLPALLAQAGTPSDGTPNEAELARRLADVERSGEAFIQRVLRHQQAPGAGWRHLAAAMAGCAAALAMVWGYVAQTPETPESAPKASPPGLTAVARVEGTTRQEPPRKLPRQNPTSSYSERPSAEPTTVATVEATVRGPAGAGAAEQQTAKSRNVTSGEPEQAPMHSASETNRALLTEVGRLSRTSPTSPTSKPSDTAATSEAFAPGMWDQDELAKSEPLAVKGSHLPPLEVLPHAEQAKEDLDEASVKPYPIQLTSARSAVWRGGEVPTAFQETLLELKSGEAEFSSPAGVFTIQGPSIVYFELPVRVTLQLGSMQAKLVDSIEIDTPFGAAAADGLVGVRSSVEGMVVRSLRGSAEMRSPTGATRLISKSHACTLTPRGRFFDWHVVLDLSRDHRALMINGEAAKLSPRQFDRRALGLLNAALTAIRRQAERENQFDVAGMLRLNGKIHLYDKAAQIASAQQEATRHYQWALAAVKSGAPVKGKPADAGQGLVEPAPWLPAGWGDDGLAAVFRRAAGSIRTNPFGGSPRIQRMAPGPLLAQLMQVPAVELYRSNEAGMKMGRMLESVANVSPMSGPPPTEPVFEILPQRPDLQGLPYLRGGACRLPPTQRNSMAMVSRLSRSMGPSFVTAAMRTGVSPEAVPALTQVLEAKSHTERVALTSLLQQVGNAESVNKLVQRAIFDVSPQVRDLAAAALVDYREQARPHLLEGLRYPWPPAAMHAAETLVRLQDKDAAPQLLELLEAPSPEAPVCHEGQWTRRELVKLNHMTNCALCHAPSTSPSDMMRTPVPMPTTLLRSTPVQKYYGPTVNRVTDGTPQGFIRADITYLRQDFSITTTTKAFRPWPDEQRFDFLVRTVPLTAPQADLLSRRAAANAVVYRRAVHFALQHLTGKQLPLNAGSGQWRAALAELKQPS